MHDTCACMIHMTYVKSVHLNHICFSYSFIVFQISNHPHCFGFNIVCISPSFGHFQRLGTRGDLFLFRTGPRRASVFHWATRSFGRQRALRRLGGQCFRCFCFAKATYFGKGHNTVDGRNLIHPRWCKIFFPSTVSLSQGLFWLILRSFLGGIHGPLAPWGKMEWPVLLTIKPWDGWSPKRWWHSLKTNMFFLKKSWLEDNSFLFYWHGSFFFTDMLNFTGFFLPSRHQVEKISFPQMSPFRSTGCAWCIGLLTAGVAARSCLADGPRW